MPVRIRTGVHTPTTDPRVIDLEEYNKGRDNFKAHYYLAGCNSSFGGQDIEINWDDLNNAVNTFCTTYSINQNVVALRFVYCYDPATLVLLLRLQICSLNQPITQGTTVYPLVTTPSAWYQISQGSMIPTQNTSLDDTTYLTNIYYCDYGVNCMPETTSQLGSDGGTEFARNVTYPWQNEIWQMYVDNGSPSGAKICFGACSYVKRSDGSTLTIWPHGLVLYLKNNGTPCLNDEDYIVLFENKGADMGTLCPTECGVYIAPVL